MHSKIFRQGVQNFCRFANASQEILAQHDGERIKRGTHINCALRLWKYYNRLGYKNKQDF